MPCHAMLCYAMPCQTKFSTWPHPVHLFHVHTAVDSNVVSSPRQVSDEGGRPLPEIGHFPSPAEPARTLVHCSRGPEARLLHDLESVGRDAQRYEGFASSSCRWTLGNHRQRKSRAGGGPFRAFRLCSFSCACACANLIVDILASGPWAASAPHSRWAFCAACRIRIMCTVALRTMYAQEHAALAGCRSRTRPCMSRQLTVTIH